MSETFELAAGGAGVGFAATAAASGAEAAAGKDCQITWKGAREGEQA